MCDPISIGAGVMMAGSVGANMMGANEQSSARSAAINAENGRQRGFQQQSTDLFNKTLPMASRESQDANAKTAADTRYTRDAGLIDNGSAVANPASGVSTTGEGQSQIARTVGMALTRGKQHARAAADVSGVGDTTAKLGVDLGRAGQWQNIFGTNMRNSAAILPQELEEANHAGSGWRTAAQIMSAVGQGAGMAGMSGVGPSWGSLFGAGGSPLGGGMQGPTQPGYFTRMFGGG